jgi:lipoprotein-releasing system permease protein
MGRLHWFIARRYLASRKKGRLLSFITWISLGGITVGVTALIVVIGVMNGMQEEIRGKILGSTPHVMVLQHGSSLRLADWQQVMETVRANEAVEAVAPFVVTKVALLRSDEYAQVADLYGIDLSGDPEASVTEMEADLRTGVYDLGPQESGLPPMVLGERLAIRMGIYTGDTVTVMTLENMRSDAFGRPLPSIRNLEVTGTFSTGMYEYDANNIYVPIEWAQGILGMAERDEVSALGVRISDPGAANEVGQELRVELGFPYYVESWITQNQALFSALELEKLAMGIILFLIVIVAAFNIVSTLVMVVVDRTSEIGILKSMGMTDGGILRVFLYQGLAIGVLGTILGTSLGLFLSWFLDTYQPIRIPPDVYFIERLPVATQPSDLLLIVAGSLLISLLATIYPAFQASRLQPVEAIRHE